MHSQPERNTERNAFAILGIAKSPWIDPAEIKERYLEAAKKAHPDKQEGPPNTVGGSEPMSTEVNEAFKILENDATRIAHLVKLETGSDLSQSRQVPEDLVDLFMTLSPLFHEADQLIRALKSAESPMLKARHFLTASPLTSKLSAIQEQLNERLQSVQAKLKEVHHLWIKPEPQEKSELLDTLTQIHSTLSYVQRWRDTINEKSFELTPG